MSTKCITNNIQNFDSYLVTGNFGSVKKYSSTFSNLENAMMNVIYQDIHLSNKKIWGVKFGDMMTPNKKVLLNQLN